VSHGTLFEFLRNEKFDSRKFFDLDQNDPITGEELPGTARGALKCNQFARAGPQSSVLPESVTKRVLCSARRRIPEINCRKRISFSA